MKAKWSVLLLVAALLGAGVLTSASLQSRVTAEATLPPADCQTLLDSAGFYYARYMQRQGSQALDSAIAYYRKAADCDNQSVTPLRYLTGALMQKGDTQAALATADRMVALGPLRLDLLSFRADLRMWAGDLAGARVDVARCRKVEDSLLVAHPDSLMTSGPSLLLMEKLEGRTVALARADSLLRLYPKQLLLRYTAAILHYGPTHVPDSLIREVEAVARRYREKSGTASPASRQP